MSDENDLNDGLDDLSYPEDDYPDEREDRDRPQSPYSSWGPYNWYPRPKPEPDISKELLKALLKSHAREVTLLREIISMNEEAFRDDNQ